MNDKKTTTVSVIVPIYNTEKYLNKCLDSIISQKLSNIEIILINNNSQDNSLKIAQSYADKNHQIHIINLKHNVGASIARNLGIRKATGKYIGFVDSDDWILEDMYLKMFDLIEETNSDFISCSAKNYIDGDYNMKIHNHITDILKTGLKQPNTREITCSIIKGGWCWKYLINRKFLINNEIFFPEKNMVLEDSVFSFFLFHHANSFDVIHDKLYVYRVRTQSTIQLFYRKNKQQDEIFYHCDILKEMLINKGIFNNYEKEYSIIVGIYTFIILNKLKGLVLKIRYINKYIYINKNLPFLEFTSDELKLYRITKKSYRVYKASKNYSVNLYIYYFGRSILKKIKKWFFPLFVLYIAIVLFSNL